MLSRNTTGIFDNFVPMVTQVRGYLTNFFSEVEVSETPETSLKYLPSSFCPSEHVLNTTVCWVGSALYNSGTPTEVFLWALPPFVSVQQNTPWIPGQKVLRILQGWLGKIWDYVQDLGWWDHWGKEVSISMLECRVHSLVYLGGSIWNSTKHQPFFSLMDFQP